MFELPAPKARYLLNDDFVASVVHVRASDEDFKPKVPTPTVWMLPAKLTALLTVEVVTATVCLLLRKLASWLICAPDMIVALLWASSVTTVTAPAMEALVWPSAQAWLQESVSFLRPKLPFR